MVSNSKIGLGVGFAAFSIYLYTMYHLKQQAPGDLSQMVSLRVCEFADIAFFCFSFCFSDHV